MLFSAKNDNNHKLADRKIFVDLSILNITFEDTPTFDNQEDNVIGNPIFWEYERVLLILRIVKYTFLIKKTVFRVKVK
ncbi:hypothetical protein [Mariniflexile sp. HMF6888]|uniref:hypothetical protein n=1 Tax=Mariniflexile sp. HMF6888 TaxID=3373086 RepID=UPI00378BCF57